MIQGQFSDMHFGSSYEKSIFHHNLALDKRIAGGDENSHPGSRTAGKKPIHSKVKSWHGQNNGKINRLLLWVASYFSLSVVVSINCLSFKWYNFNICTYIFIYKRYNIMVDYIHKQRIHDCQNLKNKFSGFCSYLLL